MIQYQILQINITRTIWRTVGRITNEILGVKGLSLQKSTENMSKRSNKDNMKRKKSNRKPIKNLKQFRNTYKSGKSAVLQARNNSHSIDSILQFCVGFGFTVRVTQLCDKNIEQNHNHHRHVGQENEYR